MPNNEFPAGCCCCCSLLGQVGFVAEVLKNEPVLKFEAVELLAALNGELAVEASPPNLNPELDTFPTDEVLSDSDGEQTLKLFNVLSIGEDAMLEPNNDVFALGTIFSTVFVVMAVVAAED